MILCVDVSTVEIYRFFGTNMWRITLFIGLLCSVALNVYLFLQLNVSAIENKFQQEASLYPQKRSVKITKNQFNTLDKDNYNEGIISGQSALHVTNTIKNAISEKDYFNARFLINTLTNDDKAALAAVRLFWLQATKKLIEKKLFSDAENSISAYLAFQPDDGDFLYQQVDLYWQQHLPLLAIKYAYEVQYHVFNEAKNRDVINAARALVQQQIDVLINNNDWLELRDLVEEVLLFDPQTLIYNGFLCVRNTS